MLPKQDLARSCPDKDIFSATFSKDKSAKTNILVEGLSDTLQLRGEPSGREGNGVGGGRGEGLFLPGREDQKEKGLTFVTP